MFGWAVYPLQNVFVFLFNDPGLLGAAAPLGGLGVDPGEISRGAIAKGNP